MAGIQTSIQLQDRMSAVLNNITQSMNLMINSCESVQAASDRAVNTAAWDAAREGIGRASAELIQYREEMGKAAAVPSPASPITPALPQAPVWESVQAPQIFINSGADRFASEFQAADQMAKQLYSTQQTISEQARQMKVTPPGMLNDVAAVSNRIQGIGMRIQQLNSVPVNLRTEQANGELEALRGKMGQIQDVQHDLAASMSSMDISAVNAQYSRLNSLTDSVERDIRDNFNAQEKFNQSVSRGTSAASGLESRIKGIAMSMIAAFSVRSIVSLSDSVTQTTARLNLMNDGLQSTDALNQKIFASAQRARAPYMDTADAIAKMGLNAGNAFSSNDELIAFMEQVNKQFVIGGASTQEQSNAMTQLSQAMAAGALRGEELNSILDAAPGIARTIEQNMGWAEGSIKQYAEKGAVSAQVVKASLLNMAQETNDKFNSMPMTFGQVITTVQNTLLQAFWPVIQLIGKGASFINEHWDAIAPVFYGVAAGILYAALAFGVLNLAMSGLLMNPFTWIILAAAVVVGIIVAAIYKWVQSMGGLKVAWLICVNFIRTQADRLMIGLATAWMNIQNGIDNLVFGFDSFKAGVLNALGNLKVMGLTILQAFINGAIERVNSFIGLVNSIAGTSIELIVPVEFAAKGALEEKAKQSLRTAELLAKKNANAASKAAKQSNIDEMQRNADRARMQGQADIEAARSDAARKAAENDNSNPSVDDTAANTGNTAANTAAMADSMDAMDEELKYMRDAAEQEIINRFTLAELKIDMTNNNTLKTETDFDRMTGMLNDVTSQLLSTAAEGGHL